jgi:hypothetical protein
MVKKIKNTVSLQANQEQPVYLLSDSSDTDLDTAKKIKKMNKATGGGTKPRKNKEPTSAAATGDLNKKKKKKGEGGEGVRRARIIHTDKAKRGPRLEAPTTPKVGAFQPAIKTLR